MNETTKVINQSSREITKNTKGYNWSVKVYGDTPEEINEKENKMIEDVNKKISLMEIQGA